MSPRVDKSKRNLLSLNDGATWMKVKTLLFGFVALSLLQINNTFLT